MSSSPVGFFDSGIGGISLWMIVNKILPNENTIYLSDSKNCPYGNKPIEYLNEICIKNTEFLISKGCKTIVVACNTATTNSISLLRKIFDVPFIGIEPAIKPAALNSVSGKIGILATKGTLSSTLFSLTSSSHLDKVELIKKDGDGLVELIEKGIFDGRDLNNLLIKYLKPMIDFGVDQIVLGCTHYPFIKPLIKKITKDINVIDCNEAVALQLKNILEINKLINSRTSNNSNHIFFNSSSDNSTINKILENKYEIFNFES